MYELVDRVFQFFERLMEARDKGRGRIGEFLFEDLGIPFELFCFGFAIVMGYGYRSWLKAWWSDVGQRRDYKPVRKLTPWEQLEKHEQRHTRSVAFAIVLFLILGFVELFFGVFYADT